jgi:hypothetical protein
LELWLVTEYRAPSIVSHEPQPHRGDTMMLAAHLAPVVAARFTGAGI